MRVTFRQRVLDFIVDYQAEYGRSPQQKEIAHGVNITSVSSVWRALKLLEDEKRIVRHRTQIKILPPSS